MTMTTHPQPGELPAWHSTFAASAEVATATVHARGTLDLFTVDLLQGAIDVLITAGCTDVILDLAEVGSIDHAAAWCIAETSAMLTSRHGHLAILNASESVQTSLGDLDCVAFDKAKNERRGRDRHTTPHHPAANPRRIPPSDAGGEQ